MANYTIDRLEKRIYENQPTEGSNGQYNYGKVDNNEKTNRILGKEQNTVVNEDSDLYTYVIQKQDINLDENKNGLLWQTFGSKLEIDECNIWDNRYWDNQVDSAGGDYSNVKVAFYIFDSETPAGKKVEAAFNDGGLSLSTKSSGRDASNGNKIKDAIGIGNAVKDSPYCIGYKNYGREPEKTELGDVISNDSTEFGNVSINNFPRKTNPGSSAPDSFDSSTAISTDITKFHDQIIGKEDGSYYLVVRTCGDEREDVLLQDPADDELDRNYTVIKIPKIELFGLWTKLDGSPRTLSATNDTLDNSNLVMRHFRDDYGDGRGYQHVGDNKRAPIYTVDEIKIKITAPDMPNFVTARKSIEDGGINANWVNTVGNDGWWCTKEQGLNPKYDIDFLGYPNTFYNSEIQITSDFGGSIHVLESTQTDENINYFSGSLITQNNFRPISFISSSDFDIDCQSYYSDERESGFQLNNTISAPNKFKLGFKLSEKSSNTIEKSIPTYFSPSDTPFNYYFFVVNWNWKDGDSETLEEIGDKDFPLNSDELGKLNPEGIDLYRLKTIGDITTDQFGERTDLAIHQYNEPGIKIIKAVVFSTINKDAGSSFYSGYNDHVQAISWKLVTIKINITEDRGIVSDFSDVGGDDFVYLPYPDVVKLDELVHGVGPNTDQPYKSSHIVISGLSEDSIYVTGLKKILKRDNFGKAEISEKIEAKKSFENSPKGKLNEYGDFLGKSDISQIRYFNTVNDMKTLLNIIVVPGDDSSYYPHSDINYWDGETNSFSNESPVGDIFISEYDQFRESCLFELNLNELDGKTVKDTSGNGNKGILIGDYSVKKDKINKKSMRDSYIKIAKIKKKNGAF